MKELVPARDRLILQRIHRAIDERHRASRVIQQPLLAGLRWAFARIALTVKIRVAHQYHPQVRIVLRQHERACTDRVPVQVDVLFVQPRLLVETLRFPRHRGEKVHRQPVHELRIFLLDTDPIGVAIDLFDTCHIDRAQIEPGLRLSRLRPQLLIGSTRFSREILKAADMPPHQACHR